jgi:hypothetical protein
MRTIFGKSVLPPDSAQVVIRAVNLMVATRDVSPRARFQAVELWAADYLAGVDAQRAALRMWSEMGGETDDRVNVRGSGLVVPLGADVRLIGE